MCVLECLIYIINAHLYGLLFLCNVEQYYTQYYLSALKLTIFQCHSPRIQVIK